jgi:tetratricopeptide (TPR) repeat protein
VITCYSNFVAGKFNSVISYGALLAVSTLFVSWPQRDPSLWALDAYNSGWQALESGDLALAENKLQLARAYVPTNPETNFALGNLRLAEGNSAAASAFYLATLQLDNHHRGALNNLGVLALDGGKFDAAENWLRHAEDVDPGNAKIHFLLAKTLLAKDEHEMAREEIEIAIRLRPNQTEFQQLKQKIEN